MKLDEAEIASEVVEIEESLKVKQNGFELFKTNSNFRRAIGLRGRLADYSTAYRNQRHHVLCATHFWHGWL